jgi:pentatricopeptide repeat protein
MEKPNELTIVAALSACAQLGALKDGIAVHEFARTLGMEYNVRVCNTLIDMYSKCGSLSRALEVFYSSMAIQMEKLATLVVALQGNLAQVDKLAASLGQVEQLKASFATL